MPSPKSSNKPKPSEPPAPQQEWSFEAIGTTWWVAIYAVPPALDAQRIYERMLRRIAEFDQAYSRFRDDSLVSLWSHKAGIFPMPPDLRPMLDFYKQLYDATDGAVTPLIGRTLSDAGYDAVYSLQPKQQLTSPPAWDEVLSYDDATLTMKQPALLDFGAVGKGYLVDIISALLEAQGVANYCVDAGGDIRYRHGQQPIRIGLEHPDDPAMAIGVAEFVDGAICGSAGNRRSWDGYNHIIDPRKLTSPKHLKAVWVSAASTMLADGLTTAVYFASLPSLQERFSFEYAILYPDDNVTLSGGFPGNFFVA